MRIAIVVPRYGPEVVGGAETLMRDYARQLSAAGHDVVVLTTCALDHTTWRNELRPGTTVVDGITVRRFPVSQPRNLHVVAALHARLEAGFSLDPASEEEWVRNTGYSEPLLAAIEAEGRRADVLLFAPYLFASTVYGARIHPQRSIVVPCLHDEPYARFQTIQRSLSECAMLVFNSEGERELAARLLPTMPEHAIVGAGFAAPTRLDPTGARRRFRLSGDLVAYAGRREAAKNFPLVVECVVAYDLGLRRRDPVTLVALGSGPARLPDCARPWVADIGYVSHETKLDLLAAAVATIQLSLMESFSYAVMESWLCGVPVIVHADCAVTRRHCEESGGGLWVRSPEEFAEALERIRDGNVGSLLGAAGRAYVLERYAWPAVMGRLLAALESVAGSTR